MRLLNWWGISGVLHFDCVHFVLQWNRLLPGHKRKNLWSLCLCCVIWSLWFERNRVIFESVSPDLDAFFYSLIIVIGVWAKEHLGFSSFSPYDVIYNSHAIL